MDSYRHSHMLALVKLMEKQKREEKITNLLFITLVVVLAVFLVLN